VIPLGDLAEKVNVYIFFLAFPGYLQLADR
jgi:hypothetical protein